MGIFTSIKDGFKKSEAAMIVSSLFETQKNAGIFQYDAATVANKLVADLWNQKPDVFSGKFGLRPHKLSVAAAALSHGIYLFQDELSLRRSCMVALAEILKTAELNSGLYDFNRIDHTLLQAATEMFVEAAELDNSEQ